MVKAESIVQQEIVHIWTKYISTWLLLYEIDISVFFFQQTAEDPGMAPTPQQQAEKLVAFKEH